MASVDLSSSVLNAHRTMSGQVPRQAWQLRQRRLSRVSPNLSGPPTQKVHRNLGKMFLLRASGAARVRHGYRSRARVGAGIGAASRRPGMARHGGFGVARSALLLACLACPALARSAVPRVDEAAACRARQAGLSTAAAALQGDPRIKRLIEAGLRRASKEANGEGGDECAVTPGHAARLLAGQV